MVSRDNFWRGKRVLLTGHTGFKGGWLALWLHRKGALVTGIALTPNTQPNLYETARIFNVLECGHFLDIRNATALANCVRTAKPEIVFHLSAQPLVRASYHDPLGTFSTNTMGTAHALDALRNLACVRVAVVVTTDKVYQNLEYGLPYGEGDPLGGHDPYSASKAASELVVACYRDAFLAAQGVAIATARAGNVIGGGDWSADRLLPDAVRAWQSSTPLTIRNPQAVRPWQHVLEPLAGYLRLAEALWADPKLAGAYNFGPNTAEAASVEKLIEMASRDYGKCASRYENHSTSPAYAVLHEAGLLILDITKASQMLGVQPRWTLAEAVGRSMRWYKAQAQGADARVLCEADIDAYESAANVIAQGT